MKIIFQNFNTLDNDTDPVPCVFSISGILLAARHSVKVNKLIGSVVCH